MSNTALWDRLGKTDPAHTKQFKRGGGFSGTAIKPMWSYRRMTEEFGPCGVGWGVNEPSFRLVEAEGEILVYCTASVWYRLKDDVATVYGVGGDKVVSKNKYGLQTDDEAFKKAYTDAITNALKLIGVGADVHMGLFEDSKYVAEMRDEFADESSGPPPRSSASLKRTGPDGKDEWQRVTDNLHNDLLDVHTLPALEKVKAEYRQNAKQDRWPQAWLSALADVFEAKREEILKAQEAAASAAEEMMEQY